MRSNELFRFEYLCALLSTDYSLQVQDGPTRCVQLGMGSWHPSWTSHCFADGTGGSKPSSFRFGVSSATPEQHCLDLRHPARSTWFDEGYQLRSQRSRGWVELSVSMYCVQKMLFLWMGIISQQCYDSGFSWVWGLDCFYVDDCGLYSVHVLVVRLELKE